MINSMIHGGSLFRLFLSDLRKRPARTGLTVLGVAAGVALVFSIAVINASLLASADSTIRATAGAAQIEVAAPDRSGLPEKLVDEISQITEVDKALPLSRQIAELTGQSGTRVQILGITSDYLSLFGGNESPSIRFSGGFGSDQQGLIVSSTVLRSLNATVGDTVEMETPTGFVDVTITGELGGGFTHVVNGGYLAVMTLGSAQESFLRRGRVDSIYVVVDNDDAITEVEREIHELAEEALVGVPGERVSGFARSFESVATLTSLNGVVALFVGGFVVYNAITMSITRRRRDISLAFALGASRSQVATALFGEAFTIGALAGLLGIAFGLLIATLLLGEAVAAYRFILPSSAVGNVVVEGRQIVLGLFLGSGVALLAAGLPIRRAAQINPVEALRPHHTVDPSMGKDERPVRRRITLVLGVALLIGVASLLITGRVQGPIAAQAAVVSLLAGVTLVLPSVVPKVLHVVRAVLEAVFGVTGSLVAEALLGNRRRTISTIAAVLLTACSAIGVAGAVNSFEAELRRSAEGWFGAPVYVRSRSFSGFTSDQPLDKKLESQFEAVGGIGAVYPDTRTWVFLDQAQAVLHATSVAEAAAEGTTDELLRTGLNQRDFVEALRDGQLAVSEFTAGRLGLRIGDRLALNAPTGRRSFPIGAIFNDTTTFDSLYMDHDVYERYWRDDRVDRFAIFPASGVSAEDVEAKLSAFVSNRRIPAEVVPRSEMVEAVIEDVSGIIAIARGSQLAATAIALITVFSTVLATVVERDRQFGLAQLVGMDRSQVGLSTVLEAGAITLVGGFAAAVVGNVLAFLMVRALEQRFAWDVPFAPPWLATVVVPITVVVAAMTTALYPRSLVRRRSPVDALRFE